ncbi:hypothetical protein XENORESO_011280 [Xenotaenia resolanae]|uniref:Uncharacterized protein n=1 Tax=Xenotaenia resolanae TaxID=208358 RepID=A0ABV0W9N8_9TELE
MEELLWMLFKTGVLKALEIQGKSKVISQNIRRRSVVLDKFEGAMFIFSINYMQILTPIECLAVQEGNGFCVKDFWEKVCINLTTKAKEFVKLQTESGNRVTVSTVTTVTKPAETPGLNRVKNSLPLKSQMTVYKCTQGKERLGDMTCGRMKLKF